MTHPSENEIKSYEKNFFMKKIYELLTKKRNYKKRKISLDGYTVEDWELKRMGIGIVHTVLWNKKGAENNTKIKITIEEI